MNYKFTDFGALVSSYSWCEIQCKRITEHCWFSLLSVFYLEFIQKERVAVSNHADQSIGEYQITLSSLLDLTFTDIIMTNFEYFIVRYHIKRIAIKSGRRYGGVLKPFHLGGPSHKCAITKLYQLENTCQLSF